MNLLSHLLYFVTIRKEVKNQMHIAKLNGGSGSIRNIDSTLLFPPVTYLFRILDFDGSLYVLHVLFNGANCKEMAA
ncbi:triosephosphate isomerase, cytosolic-like isoform X3 [Iris pallida]|uniref:Triosephosphate isomerase, cytosolic-like isoform X3 n=1 Tax=Iris pallida TaxID=29817 RepID=A0AAX6H8I5_IRIPA|nr:triosephosphate isomerase, cytosolic-like isoform X3 [Iris pallida]